MAYFQNRPQFRADIEYIVLIVPWNKNRTHTVFVLSSLDIRIQLHMEFDLSSRGEDSNNPGHKNVLCLSYKNGLITVTSSLKLYHILSIELI